MRPLFLLPILIAAAVAHAAPGALARGRGQLAGGMPMVAAASARECLEDQPRDVRCRSLLGRATATLGNCSEALHNLALARRAHFWGYKGALAEGVCHVREGRLDEAVMVFEEAAILDQTNAWPWLQRGLVDAHRGDVAAVDEAIGALEARGVTGWERDLLTLWRAHAAHDPGRDALIEALQEHPMQTMVVDAVTIQVQLVACEAWLEVDDPIAALEAADLGIRASRGHVRLRACRAEALRRLGRASLARKEADRSYEAHLSTVSLDAVLVRVLADEGELARASELLRALPLDLPEAAASGWYLARVRGDEAAAAHWLRVLDLAARHGRRFLPPAPERR